MTADTEWKSAFTADEIQKVRQAEVGRFDACSGVLKAERALPSGFHEEQMDLAVPEEA